MIFGFENKKVLLKVLKSLKSNIYISEVLLRKVVGRVAQSVQRLTTGWTARGSNPGGGESFSHRSALGPTQPLYNGYRVFPGGKAAGWWC
jgi:hypothetical protein